jgi:site-specific DNA-methyltransferase (adenine-specific)
MGHEFENKIFNGDCISGMMEIPGESMDIIITDPPFAIDFKATRANYNRTDDRVLQGYQEISASDYLGFTRAWMAEAHRLLKPTASLFIFSGWNNLKDILIVGDELGLTTVNHVIWKYQFGVVCKRKFVTSHYHCMFYCKDDKKRKFYNSARYDGNQRDYKNKSMRYKDLEDVWEIKREYWHGDVKTPTKVVAKKLARKYLGFEIVTEYFNFAKERLDKDLYRIPKEDKSKLDDLPLFGSK